MKWMVNYAARSHLGCLRENNEDNLFVNGVSLPADIGNRFFSLDGNADVPSVFAVCDGMGGEAAGEVASLLSVRALAEHRVKLMSAGAEELDGAVQAFVRQAHQAVQEATQMGQRSGSTLALAVLTGKGVRCFNLGDSRIFCGQKGRFWQVTYDHTVEIDQLRAGQTPPEGTPPDHRLTRCIGIGNLRPAEGYPVIPGSCVLLLCSDGLTDMVPQGEIESILRGASSSGEAAERLVRTALRNGGVDNVSVIVLDIRRSLF